MCLQDGVEAERDCHEHSGDEGHLPLVQLHHTVVSKQICPALLLLG